MSSASHSPAAPAAGGVPYGTLIWLAVATFTTGIDGYVLAGQIGIAHV